MVTSCLRRHPLLVGLVGTSILVFVLINPSSVAWRSSLAGQEQCWRWQSQHCKAHSWGHVSMQLDQILKLSVVINSTAGTDVSAELKDSLLHEQKVRLAQTPLPAIEGLKVALAACGC